MRFENKQLYFKCLFDRAISIIIFTIISPLLLVISLAIKIDSKGPIFFVQERVGKHKKLFKIYKFRTMVPNAINIGTGVYTDENDPRITKVGKFLRKTSLDELPQLFNIIKGEMSFIGPRPTLLYQVEQYDEFQIKRLNMNPGVTGWAQVNGRNSISWPERIKLDVWYIENWSIWLDIKIITRTFAVVFSKQGIYGQKENFLVRDKENLNA
ncbi:MAG: sugar transferase [Clostridia bacterium]|nr:sugar transferase [Clostridia bacterium]